MAASASTSTRLRRRAKEVFGWDRLRPAQLAAMQAVMERRDTVVVMPTGAGKSAVYQVPGLLLEGPTLVVSPLVALQRDQVAGLLRLDGPEAVAVNSSQGRAENDEAWDRISAGDVDFLFLAPEQLAKDDVLEQLAAARPALFVVDEAQCVSSWGHDFRPDYLRLRHALERVGRPPVLALTASAAAPVRADIVEQLGMRDVHEVVAGFDRPNIHLEVVPFRDDEVKRRAVVERAAAEPKPGIVYAATRKDAEAYAEELAALGLDAAPYHAGMRAAERHGVHDRFRDGSLDVVVATSAFGMGIDKADVRFVLHASVPGSLDAYYQEIGRAGRDGEPARAVLAYRPEDLGMQRFFSAGRPDPDTVARVARRIQSHRGPVPPTDLRSATGLSASRLTAVVNLLEQVGAVRTTDEGELAAVEGFGAARAAEEAVRLGDARQQLERSRVDMMRGFAETTGCRRRFLLGYFGEALDGPCGSCDVCEREELREDGDAAAAEGVLAGTAPAASGAAESAAPTGHPFVPGARVRHGQWGDGAVLSEEEGRLTVLFETVGYRTLSLPLVLRNDLLAAV
ncbi:RecQ family ATP-dependent DNA helicase [Streptacidiphilus sp. ASG 303]|uniref:RecQ family ATP-dependent DNA helicase n=1 Tax=Streptacidiphilus sp. ASG 303 TaxID=2896847 RepID=UPI001E2B6DBF|nr:RecQ family ATP-dependent DNA helicase [Streptacidiphilus sp. ASG 303]MCD0483665.1 RecQ family ATP-dependent DNA helicase [Streptacidiphilus sp. ASG 303]